MAGNHHHFHFFVIHNLQHKYLNFHCLKNDQHILERCLNNCGVGRFGGVLSTEDDVRNLSAFCGTIGASNLVEQKHSMFW